MEWSNIIGRKPDLDKLRKGKNISKVEDRVATAIRKKGYEVQQQLTIPNTNPHPLRADLFLPEKLLIVEIDGGKWHQDPDKQARRDGHILSMGHELGIPLSLLHVLYNIPPELLYGELSGKKRERVKSEYLKYLDNWVMNTVLQVVLY